MEELASTTIVQDYLSKIVVSNKNGVHICLISCVNNLLLNYKKIMNYKKFINTRVIS